jgi:lysylphosphatidylglycerol synthetase-like protein (DUF2156 family)
MISFIAQRIAKAIVVLLALVVLNFFLIRLAPGDPALVMAGEAGAGDQIFLAQLREKFGLDQPLPVQLFLYVKGILSLDLGFSFRQQMPVATLILLALALLAASFVPGPEGPSLLRYAQAVTVAMLAITLAVLLASRRLLQVPILWGEGLRIVGASAAMGVVLAALDLFPLPFAPFPAIALGGATFVAAAWLLRSRIVRELVRMTAA